MENNAKPITHQGNLAKLPKALAPLIARPQWAVWRWTQKPDGSWQKPPFVAIQPERHASTSDPTTWADYNTALATVQAGHADGLSYILTQDDPFGAFDLDHCRCLVTCSIDIWAQNYLQAAVNTYQEITPSGEGVRIWGFADGDPLNRKFALKINNKNIAVELFRKTNKALAITGYTLDPAIRELQNVDKVFAWALVWGERRKAAAAAQEKVASKGNGFDSSGCRYSIDEIEQFVREGAPAGTNRSDVFHAIVGHYVGCGWQPDRILEHLQEHPHGIGELYIAEDRLRQEVERSAGKYAQTELPLSSGSWPGWDAKGPPEPGQQQPDPKLEDDDLGDDNLDDDEDSDDGGDEKPPTRDPRLPELHAHGDADASPVKSWLIKRLLPEVGHGLISGQWGSGKTFVFFDLAGAVMTGQPFLTHVIKRQSGVLLIAAEGEGEVRLRLDAVVRERCGGMSRAPFRWYTNAPALLDRGATEMLIAMARQAEASLQHEFGLPLGLITFDTISACAGYRRAGDENDNAVGAAIMNVLKAVAQEMKCFVIGIDHFGKTVEAGTRGATSKEASAEVVLACLGELGVGGRSTGAGSRGRNTRSRWRHRSSTRTATRSRRWWWTGPRRGRRRPAQPRRTIRGPSPSARTSAPRYCGSNGCSWRSWPTRGWTCRLRRMGRGCGW
jgi:AAA domain